MKGSWHSMKVIVIGDGKVKQSYHNQRLGKHP